MPNGGRAQCIPQRVSSVREAMSETAGVLRTTETPVIAEGSGFNSAVLGERADRRRMGLHNAFRDFSRYVRKLHLPARCKVKYCRRMAQLSAQQNALVAVRPAAIIANV